MSELSKDDNGHYVTTEEINLRGRLAYLESLLVRLNAYLTSGKSINVGSEAHGEIFIACGHSKQEWLEHPCSWIDERKKQ